MLHAKHESRRRDFKFLRASPEAPAFAAATERESGSDTHLHTLTASFGLPVQRGGVYQEGGRGEEASGGG